jgi:hypothetical protein
MVTFSAGGVSLGCYLEIHPMSGLTELARIKCVKQLTQESASIEEPDVVLDSTVIHEAQVPTDLVTECACENMISNTAMDSKTFEAAHAGCKSYLQTHSKGHG